MWKSIENIHECIFLTTKYQTVKDTAFALSLHKKTTLLLAQWSRNEESTFWVMWVICAVWKPPSQRECTYLCRALWFPGRLSVSGRGWRLKKEKDRKWSGREWLVNTENKHILTCPQLIPGSSKSKCDRGLKERQNNTVSFETNPFEIISLWILTGRGGSFFIYLFFLIILRLILSLLPPPNIGSQLHWVSFGELTGVRLLLSCSSQMLDEVGWVGFTLWTPSWLLDVLCHQQQSLTLLPISWRVE